MVKQSKLFAALLLVLTSVVLVLAQADSETTYLTDKVNFTGSVWVAIVGLVGAALSLWLISDSKTRKMWGTISGVVVAVGVLLTVFGPALLSDDSWFNNPVFERNFTREIGGRNITVFYTTAGSGNAVSTAGAGSGGCLGVEDTTITFSALNKFTQAATGGTHRYRINGAPALTVSNAGTTTASPGDVIDVLFGNETDGSYFGVVKSEVVPCRGTHTISAEMYGNSSVTLQVFNEEGNLISEGVENETIGSGETSNMKIELRASNDFGFPYGGIIIVELNGSQYKESDTKLTLGDLRVKKVSVPDASAVTNTANKEIAFEVSAFEGSTLHTGTLTLVAESGINPGDTGDPVIEFRPYDYYINEDNGGAYEGPAAEDEDNNWVFAHVTSFTISVD